jgi:hypothetical protein
MRRLFWAGFAVVLGLLLSACTVTTTISAAQAGAMIDVRSSTQTVAPRTETYQATSFGDYEFRAQAPGYEPFFGVLPLKLNGLYMVFDTLAFPPAAAFNLRQVYPFYEFDIEKKVVRFRKNETDEWHTHTTFHAEMVQAQEFFNAK